MRFAKFLRALILKNMRTTAAGVFEKEEINIFPNNGNAKGNQTLIKHRKLKFYFRRTSSFVRRDRKNLNLITTYSSIKVIAINLITVSCKFAFFA